MLNIFADALLIATRMYPDARLHDAHRSERPEVRPELPSARHVFPKLGL